MQGHPRQMGHSVRVLTKCDPLKEEPTNHSSIPDSLMNCIKGDSLPWYLILTCLNWTKYFTKSVIIKLKHWHTNILATFFSFLLVLKYKMRGSTSHVYWSDFLFIHMSTDISDQVLPVIFWEHLIDFQLFTS